MYAHAFVPLITKPTRITAHSATLIDNIFTNNTDTDRQQYPGILYNDISDHLPVFCFDKCISVNNEDIYIKKRIINDNSILDFKHRIQQPDWCTVTGCFNLKLTLSNGDCDLTDDPIFFSFSVL